MSIPQFQAIFLPLLKQFNDKKEHSTSSIYEALEAWFKLTPEDKGVFLKSGDEPLFTNRVRWACMHLKAARLIVSTRKGVYKITDRGISVLRMQPKALAENDLKKFSEYLEFRKKKKKDEETNIVSPDPETPAEKIESAHAGFDEYLMQELLLKVRKVTPRFFEKLVVDLLVKMGYGGSREDAARVVGMSGDEGVDGVINEDRLGFNVIYIQAKRWMNSVGRPELQKFVGALHGKSSKGVFITTSEFTSDAIAYVEEMGVAGLKIRLIDGEQLVKYMFEFEIGCSAYTSYDMKRIDSDYFENDIDS